MLEFLLVVHVLIAASMIGVILLQRSEGGALGIGGGGGFMTGRGQANFLTRVTAGLAIAFFITSLLLTILAHGSRTGGTGILDRLTPPATTAPATPPASGGAAPTSGTPATTAPAPANSGASGGGTVLDRLKDTSKTP